MKLDVEGMELLALQGAGDALRKIDTIVFEVWETDLKRSDVADFLQNAGFIIKVLDGRNCIATRKTF